MKRADFDNAQRQFRQHLIRESKKPEHARKFWEEGEGPLTCEANVVCHTEGCVNENVPFTVNVPVNADGVFRVYCGRCSQQAHDLKGRFDDEKDVELATSEDEAEPVEEDEGEPNPGRSDGAPVFDRPVRGRDVR